MALLLQKLWREKQCQNPFPTLLRRKKKLFCPLSRGGGGDKGLSGMSTKRKRIFCGFPKAFCVKHLSLKIMFLVLSCDFRNFCNICKSSKVYLVRQVVYSITCSCLSIVTLCKKNNVVYQNTDICINNLSN